MSEARSPSLSPPERYSRFAQLLHWLVAVLVLGMIPAGLVMVTEGIDRPLQDSLFIFHKNAGVIVLMLMVLRLLYRLAVPPPPLPATMPGWQAFGAHAVHLLLYAAVLTMAVSGFVRVMAGGFPIEGMDRLGLPRLVPKSEPLANLAMSVHFATHYVVIAAIGLHVAAALYHGLIRRDGIFSRMWPRV